MRTDVVRHVISMACVVLPPALVAMTPQIAAPPSPHRPLFDVRLVLLPAAPRSSALPPIALDQRAAIQPGSLAATATSVRWFGAPGPNVEVCYRRGCESRSEPQRVR